MLFRGLCFLVIAQLAACSMAPVHTSQGARTLGKGEVEAAGGLMPYPAVSIGVGVAENTDVHTAAEVQAGGMTLSAWLKHAIKKTDNGWSVAALAGAFRADSLVNSKGYFVAPVASYSQGRWEWYAQPRYNRVNLEKSLITLKDDDKDLYVFDLADTVKDFGYWQADVGAKYHGSKASFHAGASCFMYDNSGCIVIPFLGGGLKF